MLNDNTQVLFCNCNASDIIATAVKNKLRTALENAAVPVTEIDELCGMVARKDPSLSRITTVEDLVIIACYPRSIKWLFRRAGFPLNEEHTRFFNMREQSADAILDALGIEPISTTATCCCCSQNVKPPEWIPWYPVIDYDRCINCGKCLDFCLFGVYDRDEQGNVHVAKPRSCKTNCPACARICPNVAIIFPKVPDSPINGAKINEAALDKQTTRLDMKQLTGNDVYTALAARKSRAKSKLLKANANAQALAERDACLCEKARGDSPEDPDNPGNNCSGDCNCSSNPDNTPLTGTPPAKGKPCC